MRLRQRFGDRYTGGSAGVNPQSTTTGPRTSDEGSRGRFGLVPAASCCQYPRPGLGMTYFAQVFASATSDTLRIPPIVIA